MVQNRKENKMFWRQFVPYESSRTWPKKFPSFIGVCRPSLTSIKNGQSGFHQEWCNCLPQCMYWNDLFAKNSQFTRALRVFWVDDIVFMIASHAQQLQIQSVTNVTKALLKKDICKHISNVCIIMSDTIVIFVAKVWQIWADISKVYMRYFDTIVISVSRAFHFQAEASDHDWRKPRVES